MVSKGDKFKDKVLAAGERLEGGLKYYPITYRLHLD